jgi:uncharacterized protein YecE (DUF72 family)
MKARPLYIGTAGWSIPALSRDRFPAEGTHLQRYASVFNAVEINSSFYRPHRAVVYARWAESVPDDFRFAVKIPKIISHDKRLVGVAGEVDRFLTEIAGLGGKLGPLLLQLPGSFDFATRIVDRFFTMLRRRHDGAVVCEPRNPGWYTTEAGGVLRAHGIARVAADPARFPAAAHPGNWGPLRYYRLHGSPVIYRSGYSQKYLSELVRKLSALPAERWCIFDNTMFGAATANALSLSESSC